MLSSWLVPSHKRLLIINMELRKYKIILNVGLLVSAGVFYWSRFLFYLRMQPSLKPESDSISIPLFEEGIILFIGVMAFLVLHYLIGKRLLARNATQVKNLYAAPQLILLRAKVIALIFLIIFWGLYGINAFYDWMDLGLVYADIISLLCLVTYFAALLNYWLNGYGVKASGAGTGVAYEDSVKVS